VRMRGKGGGGGAAICGAEKRGETRFSAGEKGEGAGGWTQGGSTVSRKKKLAMMVRSREGGKEAWCPPARGEEERLAG